MRFQTERVVTKIILGRRIIKLQFKARRSMSICVNAALRKHLTWLPIFPLCNHVISDFVKVRSVGISILVPIAAAFCQSATTAQKRNAAFAVPHIRGVFAIITSNAFCLRQVGFVKQRRPNSVMLHILFQIFNPFFQGCVFLLKFFNSTFPEHFLSPLQLHYIF